MKKGAKVVTALLALTLIVVMSLSLVACDDKTSETQLTVDQKVDATIAKYLETIQAQYAKRTNCCWDSMYWDDMIVAANNANSTTKITPATTDAFKDTLSNIVISEKKDWIPNEDGGFDEVSTGKENMVDYMRYYYALKANGLSLDDFKEKYEKSVEKYDVDYSIENAFEFVLVLGLAKNLGVESASLKAENLAKNNPLVIKDMWGNYDNSFLYDIFQSQYNKYTKEDLGVFLDRTSYAVTAKSFTGSNEDVTAYSSDALTLMLYASCNVNVRDAQKELGLEQDTIEYLVSKIDPATGLILNNPKQALTHSDNGTVNQLYAGLISYKIQRDTGKAFNILAI